MLWMLKFGAAPPASRPRGEHNNPNPNPPTTLKSDRINPRLRAPAVSARSAGAQS